MRRAPTYGEINGCCDRCHVKTNTTIMGRFCVEILCLNCEAKEKRHPQYAEAVKRKRPFVVGSTTSRGLASPATCETKAGRLQRGSPQFSLPEINVHKLTHCVCASRAITWEVTL